MRKLTMTLLKTGATFEGLKPQAGCYEKWFSDVFGDRVNWRIIDAPGGDELPPFSEIEALVISGSPVSVYERLPWSERCSSWLGEFWTRGTPILGVCYGHQLMADALGGEVKTSPNGREMGATSIDQVGQDPIFDGLPAQFDVWQTHVDVVQTLPPQARIIASNPHCPVQAMAIGDHCRTVQWHPEMTREILAYYVRARAEIIEKERGIGSAQQLEEGLPPFLGSGARIVSNFLTHFCGV